MKINNKMIGLSLVVATTLLTGCVKDTLFDEPTPMSERPAKLRTIYSNITEMEVIISKDMPQEEFDKVVIETLNNKTNLSANDLSHLFGTVGKTFVASDITIFSVDNQPFEYNNPVTPYPIMKTVNGTNAVLMNNGYYSNINININEVNGNKFNIESKMTKVKNLQNIKVEYKGVINQAETYPLYISKEDNNKYKIVFINVQSLVEKKK